MDRQYQPLPIRELGEAAGLRRPVQVQAARVTLESPALEVMTDLSLASPATIRPQAPIEGARQYMMSRGVRLLLVVDDRDTVLGVLAASDILGEKAVRVAIERGMARDELLAGDLMTSAAQVEVLEFDAVSGARVGHILETLRHSGRQHALVVDCDVVPSGNLIDAPILRTMVRGILSLSQLGRQLGVALQATGEVARTFSEIELAIGR